MIEATIAPGRNGREASVRQRYSAAARSKEDALCCPVSCSREYLDVIPEEITAAVDLLNRLLARHGDRAALLTLKAEAQMGLGDWENVDCVDCGLVLPGDPPDPTPPNIPTDPFFQDGPDTVIICSEP